MQTVASPSWGNESLLAPEIENSEFFQTLLMLSGDAHGGVFIAFMRDLLCTETPELDADFEIIWCELNIMGCRTVFILSSTKSETRDREKNY